MGGEEWGGRNGGEEWGGGMGGVVGSSGRRH